MRALPLCLLALSLTGCSLLHKPYKPITPPAARPTPVETHTRSAVRPTPVKLYTDMNELLSNPFRDLGEVSGEDCQTSRQGSPANINTARKRMQIRASYMKANAVLLHKCEVVNESQGCYRQAVCQGTALKVSDSK
ncbi:MAG: Rcs stress response system protein RcsF [Mixta calida]|uniref:Outer membrane lipoprotein RcsF n=1 Tax=Mixta calida TaxID=665913 RepID=A0ABM6RYV4_9GAMM|nr:MULTISPECIES: Rcs stress response system protein RcsF [Mixta]AIX74751.1 membrane protein [Pantoea sp. PSNIH2]MBS6058663.1 Rcs stress response system protein RcsF [Pantoea sp.]POU49259.1 Rcs stress response system protein RcsF [Pantoea sp. PSNIH5]POU67517.1 Rcs stress response system protein RcsF [Pantoea sp. PSNIH4]POY69074.1 Rcs stress response system protein RcsF [Pantoea sp. PSNIH3]HCW47179.1 Rcs stress response system protein RcsF [Erwiniaceae bacterium]